MRALWRRGRSWDEKKKRTSKEKVKCKSDRVSTFYVSNEYFSQVGVFFFPFFKKKNHSRFLLCLCQRSENKYMNI